MLSQLAYDTLYQQLVADVKQPTRATVYRRREASRGSVTYNGSVMDYRDTSSTTQPKEGLSWALTQLARVYDLDAWCPTPKQYNYHSQPLLPLFYTPQDHTYLQAIANDPNPTPDDELPDWEVQERLYQLQLQPAPRSLCLDTYVRQYYADLAAYNNIPPRPRATHPNSLTSRVSLALEAIGTGHLELPVNKDKMVYQAVVNATNMKKSHTVMGASHKAKLYGNFEGTPYMRAKDDQWRPIPSLVGPDAHLKYTQQDIDACYKQGLEDLALLVLAQRPDLHVPATARPKKAQLSTPTVRGDNLSLATRARKYRLTHTVPAEPVYLYKGRDVSEAVQEAYDERYTKGIPLARMVTIMKDYGIPYLALYNLVQRKHAQQVMNQHAQHSEEAN